MNYDPSSYPQGVPNPYGPRVHAWNGGAWDQGTRYHGSVWTRPQQRIRWSNRPIAGLGQADTRDGVFGGEGYGGGLFDGNVSMTGVGSIGYEQAAAGVRGLGAADPGALVLQRFLNVWLQQNDYCKIAEDGNVGPKTCGAAQANGYALVPELRAECDRKGYMAPSRAPCASTGAPASPGQNIAANQILANMWLTANGYCEINVDGIMGSKTCGAFRASDMPPETMVGCTSFTAPSGPPCPGAQYTPPPDEPQPIEPSPVPGPTECPAGQVLVGGQCVAAGPVAKKTNYASMLIGGVLLAAVVGGAAYAIKKKPMKANRRRASAAERSRRKSRAARLRTIRMVKARGY